MHSERCFFTFSNKVVFSRFIFRTYFWLEKCEHEARSCTCHSPRTVLAAASIFAMLVLYQLLLKCTKCQYGELTVSLLFSAPRNTRHAHRALVSRNLNTRPRFTGCSTCTELYDWARMLWDNHSKSEHI